VAVHDDVENWDARGAELEREGEIGLPFARAAARWIASLVGARPPLRVLDVGAGPGVFTGVLAEQFSTALVTAVDGAADLLARARARAGRLGIADRVDTLPADLGGDLGGLPEADVIWVSRVLHHLPDQGRALQHLGARLPPGGLLAVVEGGLPTRFLPEECGVGPPGLLYRIDAAAARVISGMLREHHESGVPRPVHDWPMQLATAGLVPSGSQSFVLDLPAPVDASVRDHVRERLERARSWVGEDLFAEDAAAIDRLLDPEDELGVARRPDLFYLSAMTVHTARAIG
jgi:SAM-dependent methyltransferase